MGENQTQSGIANLDDLRLPSDQKSVNGRRIPLAEAEQMVLDIVCKADERYANYSQEEARRNEFYEEKD